MLKVEVASSFRMLIFTNTQPRSPYSELLSLVS